MPGPSEMMPDIFLQLKPQTLAELNAGQSTATEHIEWYGTALEKALNIPAQEVVTEQLLWDLSATLVEQKDVVLTPQDYIHLALFFQPLYAFIRTLAQMVAQDPASINKESLSWKIAQALVDTVAERSLPTDPSIAINLFDHYLAEYLFSLNRSRYIQGLDNPQSFSQVLPQVISLTCYGARNAFRDLHGIYAQMIQAAENIECLERISEELEQLYTTHQLREIFFIGAYFHLLVLYTHILNAFNCLAPPEITAIYEQTGIAEALTNPYPDSPVLELYKKLQHLQEKALALTEILNKLFAVEDAPPHIYSPLDISRMREDYEQKFCPSFIKPETLPTAVFHNNAEVLWKKFLRANHPHPSLTC